MNYSALLRPLISIVCLSIIALGSACQSSRHPEKAKPEQNVNLGKPQIHSIGNQSVVSFSKDSDLVIPIEGVDFDDPTATITVIAQGVSPISKNHYSWTVDSSSTISLVISNSYLKNAASADPLTVSVRFTHDAAKAAALVGDLNKIKESIKSHTGKATAPTETIKSADRVFRNYPSVRAIEQWSPSKIQNLTFEDLPTLDVAANDLIKRVERVTKNNFLTYGTRKLVLYETQDFRSAYLQARIGVIDITGYPLSYEQTKTLFGRKVANEFFVVSLALRSTANSDRLVNVGMIKAYGRALVIPGGESPNFTVPIEIVPETRDRVYTFVADSKPYRPREWVFRSLEFGGSLATAIAVPGGSPDLIKGLGLFTGIVIPESKKLWPDPVPAYLLNIVNNGWPTLIKIPRNNSAEPKFLFFSKGKLQAAIPDPAMLGAAGEDKIKPIDASVVYLSFDTLDIPFETVVPASGDSVEVRIARALNSAQDLMSLLDQTRDQWVGTPNGKLADLLSLDTYSKLTNQVASITNLVGADLLSPRSTNDGMVSFVLSRPETNGPLTIKVSTNVSALVPRIPVLVPKLQRLLMAFDPGRISNTLQKSPLLQRGRLSQSIQRLEQTKTAILGGKLSEFYAADVAEFEKNIQSGRKGYDFVQSAAKFFAAEETAQALADIQKLLQGKDSKEADDEAVKAIERLEKALRELAPLNQEPPLVPDFSFK